RVGRRTARIQRNLQSPALDVRHSIAFVILKKKSRQCRRRKAQVSSRQSKIENFLSRHEESWPSDFRKQLRQPRPARKNKLPGRNLLAGFCFDRPKRPLRFGLVNKRVN